MRRLCKLKNQNSSSGDTTPNSQKGESCGSHIESSRVVVLKVWFLIIIIIIFFKLLKGKCSVPTETY